MIDKGHKAFKESVKLIVRAFDPEHEVSEVEDTLKDILENKIIITMAKELCCIFDSRMPYKILFHLHRRPH